MTLVRTGRRKSLVSAEPQSAGAQELEVEQNIDWVGDWSTGAQANSAAMLRWTVWGLIVLGPRSPTCRCPPRPRPRLRRPPHPHRLRAADRARPDSRRCSWPPTCRASHGDETKLAAYYPPAGNLQLEGVNGQRRGEQLTVVRLWQTDESVWSVTVAARVVGPKPSAPPSTQPDDDPSPVADSVWYFQVPVATAPGVGERWRIPRWPCRPTRAPRPSRPS